MNAVIRKHRDVVEVTIPLRTVSESNAREHWAPKAKRAKSHRSLAALVVRPQVLTMAPPWHVTVARIAPRRLDDDNLRGCLKACRDGIADALGLTSDSDPRVSWEYHQERGGVGEYGVRIRIEGGR